MATQEAPTTEGSPLLDTRAVPLREWTLAWEGGRLPVRVPSAWEDYGIPRAFEGPCNYHCAFTATPESGVREWLHFGGASYEARGFVNDAPIGVHRGIWDNFCWDITGALRAGENRLRVQILKNGGATYPVPQVLSGFLPYVSCAFGGLWQAVHRFQTGASWLCDLWARGEADGRVEIAGVLGGALPATVRLTLHDPDDRPVAEARSTPTPRSGRRRSNSPSRSRGRLRSRACTASSPKCGATDALATARRPSSGCAPSRWTARRSC
jgi:hypothetical protein